MIEENLIVAPNGPFEIRPPGRPLEGPTGTMGPQCSHGPLMFLSSLSKPLSYSVDVYRSLRDAEFVAVSSFPILSASNSGNVKAGDRIKPYAVGKTLQDATNKLADSIRAWTARKELSVINEHLHIDRYICVHCQGLISTFPSKQELITHLNNYHSGNLSIDRYTNPSAANSWLVLP